MQKDVDRAADMVVVKTCGQQRTTFPVQRRVGAPRWLHAVRRQSVCSRNSAEGRVKDGVAQLSLGLVSFIRSGKGPNSSHTCFGILPAK